MKWKVLLDKYCLPNSESTVLVIPKNVEAKVIEPENISKSRIDLVIESGAKVEYISAPLSVVELHVIVKEGASFRQTFLFEVAQERKQTVILDGTKASVFIKGTYHLKKASGTFTIDQIHRAAETSSFVTVKTVLDGTAHFSYYGNMHIQNNAPQSKAHQENKNLVISPYAKAFSIPSLEALNNDVECGHATAVSYIDKDHLFYCASRGITPNEAKDMIVTGFINS
jgi:Fe-S cluster assembly scaffold protein SufB